jgi:hypothetical protein
MFHFIFSPLIITQLFYLMYTGVQLIIIHSILHDLSKENRLRSWQSLFTIIAMLFNIFTIMRAIGGILGLCPPLTLFFPANQDLFRAIGNTYVILYWAGIVIHGLRLRRHHHRMIRLRQLQHPLLTPPDLR